MKKKINGLIFRQRKSNKINRNHIFFKRPSKINKKIKRNSNNTKKQLSIFITVLIVILLIFSLIYFAYLFIGKLRDNEKILKEETVYGFTIPAYKGTEFIFKDRLDDETVKTFISTGYSIYRLPKNTTIDSVYKYYDEILPTLGWTKVLSVPISSEEKLPGQYWTNGNSGLRIFSRLNDVWYQNISVLQANNGLEEEVKKDVERKLLLLTTEKSDLLPDFQWRLSYPSEYRTKYYTVDIGSFQGVTLQKIGSDDIYIIEPVSYYGAISYDSIVEKFLSSYNKKSKTKWKIVSNKVSVLNQKESLNSIITNGKQLGEITTVKNEQNTLVYVIVTFSQNDPFYKYILSNIKDPGIID